MGYGDDFTEEPIFRDCFFRKKPKKHNHEWPIVDAPELGVVIADSHAHLDMLPDPPLALVRAGAHNVGFIESMIDPIGDGGNSLLQHELWITQAQVVAQEISTSLQSAPLIPRVRVAIGIHPHYAQGYTDKVEAALIEDLHNPLVSAVGEIGLDYHYDLSPRMQQKQVFARQLEIAKTAHLPVLLHVREAHDDAFAIMQEIGWPSAGTLLHCYTSDATELKRWVDADCYVAFGGAFTFKKLEEVRHAATIVPRDRLLFETDAPYMTPEPFRGATCEPAHTIFTAQRVIEYFQAAGIDCTDLLAQTYKNTIMLLDRAPTEWQVK